nr:hypothetical protein [Tanacetum cinerariifolium]
MSGSQPPSSSPSNQPLSSPPPLPQGRKSNTDKINNNSRNGYCASWCLHKYLFISRKKKMNRQNLPPLDHIERLDKEAAIDDIVHGLSGSDDESKTTFSALSWV